jgi:Haspin like kinase domain
LTSRFSFVLIDSFIDLVLIIFFSETIFRTDGIDVYTNLGADPALFEGQGDFQFEVYRQMKDING